MSYYVVIDESLGQVADAIRSGGETSNPLAFPNGFVDAIENIEG